MMNRQRRNPTTPFAFEELCCCLCHTGGLVQLSFAGRHRSIPSIGKMWPPSFISVASICHRWPPFAPELRRLDHGPWIPCLSTGREHLFEAAISQRLVEKRIEWPLSFGARKQSLVTTCPVGVWKSGDSPADCIFWDDSLLGRPGVTRHRKNSPQAAVQASSKYRRRHYSFSLWYHLYKMRLLWWSP